MITLPQTDVLNYVQLLYLASNLPQPCKKEGRKPYSNIELLGGILQVLRSGCRWRDLDYKRKRDDASGVTHWRRLQYWKKSKAFPSLWRHLLNQLQKDHKLNVQLFSIDGTVIQSFHFRECTGFSGGKKKYGVNVASVVDASGIPLTFRVDKGNMVDISMAQPTLNQINVPIHALFKSVLLADRGYDSRAFRAYLYERCIHACIPQTRRSKNKELYDLLFRPPPEDAHKKRYVVERTNAWFKSFRRLKFRFDKTKISFEAFLYLAVLVICIKKLM